MVNMLSCRRSGALSTLRILLDILLRPELLFGFLISWT